MTKILNKITSIRNWIGKIVFWLLGLGLLLSQNYGYILEGFLLTDRTFDSPDIKYYALSGMGLVLCLGGWRLNALIDKFLNLKKSDV